MVLRKDASIEQDLWLSFKFCLHSARTDQNQLLDQTRLILYLEPHLSKFIQRLFFLLINSNLVTNVNLWLKSPKNKEFGDSSVYFWDSPFFFRYYNGCLWQGSRKWFIFHDHAFSDSMIWFSSSLSCKFGLWRTSSVFSIEVESRQADPPTIYVFKPPHLVLTLYGFNEFGFQTLYWGFLILSQIEQSCQPKVPIYQQLHHLNNLVSGFSRFLVRSFINLLQKF